MHFLTLMFSCVLIRVHLRCALLTFEYPLGIYETFLSSKLVHPSKTVLSPRVLLQEISFLLIQISSNCKLSHWVRLYIIITIIRTLIFWSVLTFWGLVCFVCVCLSCRPVTVTWIFSQQVINKSWIELNWIIISSSSARSNFPPPMQTIRFTFLHICTPALRPTQLPIQWVPVHFRE
jgi:hypothetical protein